MKSVLPASARRSISSSHYADLWLARGVVAWESLSRRLRCTLRCYPHGPSGVAAGLLVDGVQDCQRRVGFCRWSCVPLGLVQSIESSREILQATHILRMLRQQLWKYFLP